MSSRLPFEPLRAFVHAAELGSFKYAAQRLSLSPGAVSQRIATLEQHLGAALFERGVRTVRLTRRGRALFDELRGPTCSIERALAKVPASKSKATITLETIPSFASYWLVPRLGTFSSSCPGIDVNVRTSTALSDLRSSGNDIAIRYGSGDYPGLLSKRLFSPELVVVGSPGLFDKGWPDKPEDCLRYPLLQDGTLNEWQSWISSNGLSDRNVTWGPTFADDGLMLKAACEGQGLAMLRDFYAEEALDNAKLLVVIRRPLPTVYAYFLVGLPHTFDRPEIKLFSKWLDGHVPSAPLPTV